jgi:hypothetical protein
VLSRAARRIRLRFIGFGPARGPRTLTVVTKHPAGYRRLAVDATVTRKEVISKQPRKMSLDFPFAANQGI